MRRIASRSADTLVCVFFVVLLSTLSAFAQNITGVVTNGTTNKPAAGVEVTLITLGQGMVESGSAKTDAQGKYSLAVDSSPGPHLIRATYQGTSYFKMVPPGFTSGDVEIYDSAKKVDGIAGNVNILRMQADSGNLQFMELFAVRNTSSPPRTLVGDTTFDIVLPDGAVIDEADAASPNGQPISTTLVPLKQKNHYGFAFALKPGETRLQVAYHIPYTGQATITPSLTLPFDHFVVMTPTTMKVAFKNPTLFQPMNDQPGANIQTTAGVRAGEDVSFTVSGIGSIQDTQDAQSQSAGGMTANQAATVNRVGPGGGLGPPIDSPDALAEYRWPLLGVMLIVIFGVSYLTLSRTSAPAAVTAEGTTVEVAAPSTPVAAFYNPAQTAAPPKSGNSLLDAMKDELFALELERQQGQISQKEYEEQKAALDQTLKRALARSAKKT
jgi:hypothetical protein